MELPLTGHDTLSLNYCLISIAGTGVDTVKDDPRLMIQVLCYYFLLLFGRKAVSIFNLRFSNYIYTFDQDIPPVIQTSFPMSMNTPTAVRAACTELNFYG